MENRLENTGWMSVPQFGGWDKNTDYSMVFSRARANKKHHKAGMRPSSLGNAEELMAYQQCQNDAPTMVNDAPTMVGQEVSLMPRLLPAAIRTYYWDR